MDFRDLGLDLRRARRWTGGSTAAQRPKTAMSPRRAGVAPSRLRTPRAFAALAAPPVFITGFARSGTTWTLDLFAVHPQVCTVFETWLLTRSGVTGAIHQPHWLDDHYAREREKLGFNPGVRQLLSYEEMSAELGELVARWLMRAMGPEHRFLVEKSPLEVGALAAMFPQARLVHVVRDGRDVALSIRAAAGTWAPSISRGQRLRTVAERWGNAVAELRREGSQLLGERYLEVRYEDMHRDLSEQMRSLYSFAEIPLDESVLELARQHTDLNAYDPNVLSSGFRGAGKVRQWRDVLSRAQGREFDRGAGDILVELGYEVDRDWWKSLPRRRPRRGVAQA